MHYRTKNEEKQKPQKWKREDMIFLEVSKWSLNFAKNAKPLCKSQQGNTVIHAATFPV